MATTGDVWIIPSFSNSGLCAACWAHFMYHHELWPTSVSHPFSFINSSVLLEENITRKLLSLPLELFFKILLFQVTFNILFSIAIFSPYFLLVGLLLQYVALFQLQSGNTQFSSKSLIFQPVWPWNMMALKKKKKKIGHPLVFNYFLMMFRYWTSEQILTCCQLDG